MAKRASERDRIKDRDRERERESEGDRGIEKEGNKERENFVVILGFRKESEFKAQLLSVVEPQLHRTVPFLRLKSNE